MLLSPSIVTLAEPTVRIPDTFKSPSIIKSSKNDDGPVATILDAVIIPVVLISIVEETWLEIPAKVAIPAVSA